MITYIILNTLAGFLAILLIPLDAFSGLIGGILPQQMLAYFSNGVAYFGAFLGVFWPLQPVWTVAMWYIGVKVALMILRLVVGSRSPDAS